MYGLARVSTARVNNGRWEVGLIDRVGEVLSLEADAVIGFIMSPAFSYIIDVVSGVDLQAGLGGQDFELTA